MDNNGIYTLAQGMEYSEFVQLFAKSIVESNSYKEDWAFHSTFLTNSVNHVKGQDALLSPHGRPLS
jgi:hypothetical protein